MTQVHNKWMPPNFSHIDRGLDDAIQKAFINTYTVENLVAGTQSGTTVVTGSLMFVPTGLSLVNQVTASVNNGTTAHNYTVTALVSARKGCIDLYVWQPASSGNNTPIPATSPANVQWIVQGRA